ncbi:DUF2169 family type VI secretion system accessory protein [Acinetobacter lanii]|uniref:DUF2169 domain-containing protein n=1 Tax=Acinetobacter lanii TaxID=2715163 RepID=A0A6G8S4A3_9GAMM|nr:DUF2169 domain-containing protein [Acinetobacter lanii]QIO08920.1 DUF2169 domain-containing protein [Acinetobacter lanii]
MTLENNTVFPALLYTVADAQRTEKYVVVMKVSYKINRLSENQWDLELIEDGSIPLCLADEYWGEIGKSSVKIESDLAPFKPKCDVIINGSAYSKNEKPVSAIAVRIRLSVPKQHQALIPPKIPQPLNPKMPLTESQKKQWIKEQQLYEAQLVRQKNIEYVSQLEKTLSVLGESHFEQNILLPGWKRTRLAAFVACPIRWEYTFGGHHFLKKNDNDLTPVLNEACYTNPLGCGWVDSSYFECCEKVNHYKSKTEKLKNFKIIKAPRVEQYLQRQKKPAFIDQAKKGKLEKVSQMQEIASKYPFIPAGFGFIGRSWLPRIAYAGTYDQKWLDEQHPYPPFDMDYRYWNGAPEDQQIEVFNPASKLELWNLVHPNFSDDGYLCVHFKGHQPLATICCEDATQEEVALKTETVLIDTDQMTISLTHKVVIDKQPESITLIRLDLVN